ncbi:hypothetical protein BDA96_05G045100 [Sorghum bicolor]|uniref:Transcription repressor n=1 Tax=Sorghum bicolor TaxID=4558 RepID=A0A921QVL4_SORBI|nr:hypothetical protein BDA96_05G045100 [Sorghum bicolor]
MSSTRARGGGGGGTRQFPVGRHRRYAPVVDAGCGCRPRRPRLLRLPSFLKPCSQLMMGSCKAAATTTRSGGGGEQYSCASTSTASFSSSSAATHSTGGYASAYSSDYYYCYPSRVVYGSCTAKQHHELPLPLPPVRKQQQQQQASPARAPPAVVGKRQAKKKQKRSSDPRADFRDSMVQMVVEMGLCDWDGLRGMLRRLLALNAPRHHAAILTAFAEVCTQIAGAAAAAAPPTQPSPPASYQYRR